MNSEKKKIEFEISEDFQKVKKPENLLCKEVKIQILGEKKLIEGILQEEKKFDDNCNNIQPAKIEVKKFKNYLTYSQPAKIEDDKHENTFKPELHHFRIEEKKKLEVRWSK